MSRLSLSLVFCFALANCGGGGGGGGGSIPQAPAPQNDSPRLSDIGNKQILEGSDDPIASVSASDSDGDSLSFTLSGPDSGSFVLSNDQDLNFISIPDFENPIDSDQNNVYSLTITVSDGSASDQETIEVVVVDAYDGRVVDGPISGSVIRVKNQGGDTLSQTSSDEEGFWIISDGVDESAFQISATGGIDTATGAELSDLVLISDVPIGLLRVNINALTSITASVAGEAEKDSALTRLGLNISSEELLNTDIWADAVEGDISGKALQRMNYQANVLLLSSQTIVSSLSLGETDAILTLAAWGRAVINAQPSDGTLSLADPEVVELILQDTVSTQIPQDPLMDSLISAVSEIIADLNTVFGDEHLDPTSNTAIGVAAVSQVELQNLTAQVFSGAIDEALFIENIDPINLFANIPVDDGTPDADTDGLADSIDPDDDNDDVRDNADAFPLDSTESVDTDGDGIGNNADTDDDGDGVLDLSDAFPLDPLETTDTDSDGIGNNADTDDDGDGVEDNADAFPLDSTESIDTDGDGIGNNADTDDDGDGVEDNADAFPLDSTESIDTDGDGIGNNADTDDDGDGVLDLSDAFPLDPLETTDTDSDGIGNNADTDDDGDGVEDNADAFPLDSTESIDTDGDGIGNNADTDDDGDGVEDAADNCPLLPNEDQLDTDGDGQGNVCDADDDNDGVEDTIDAFPLDPTETLDTDSDGVGNNADIDDDGDGVGDDRDPAPLDASITPPTASIAPSKTEGLTPELILFEAAESIAGNSSNRITSFEWQVSDDTTASGSSLSKIFSDAGLFEVTMTVTNDQGLSDSATVQVSIEEFTGPIVITGKVLLGALQQVDSDVNQYLSEPTSNNNFGSAQYRAIPSITSGYVNEPGTGPDYTGSGHLTGSGDEFDVYEINAAGNETIRLIIGDTTADLDLIVYDPEGQPVAYSVQPAGALDEIVQIPATPGTYYIVVTPWADASRYALSIDTSTSQASAVSNFSSEVDIMTGEIIVTFKTPQSKFKQVGKQLEPFVSNSYRQSNPEQRIRKLVFGAGQINALRSLKVSRPNYQKFIASKPSLTERKLMTHYLAKELLTDPSVETAEANAIDQLFETIPNDQYFDAQWHYKNLSLPSAWDIETGSDDVVIAVIDSGITQHPDLIGNLSSDGFDFISSSQNSGDGDGIDSDPTDPGGGRDNVLCPADARRETSSFHGTHVGGTIAAMGGNERGVTGVSWSSRLMDLRVCGCLGCSVYDQVQALLYAARLPNDSGTVPDRKADVINMSLGGPGYKVTAANTIQRVRDEGVIVIAASGNDGDSTVNYPASYDGVVSVGATTFSDQRSYFSSYNEHVDIAAPGGNLNLDENSDGYLDGVLSTASKFEENSVIHYYGFNQGTSMASPHVSGVAALMESVTDITPAEFDTLIVSGSITSDIGDAGYDPQYGFGLINGLSAVEEARRILSGGSVEDFPVLRVSPSDVFLSATQASAQLSFRNVGTGTLEIVSVSSSTNWLSILAPTTDDGLGIYELSVDREGLAEGTYLAEITVESNSSNGLTTTISVRMNVAVESPPEPDAGMMWINFYNVVNGESSWAYWRSKSSVGDYYSFEQGTIELPAGVYVVYAGTDPDNSGELAETGEAFGYYGGGKLPTYIIANKDVSDIDFYVPYLQPITVSDQSVMSEAAQAEAAGTINCNENCASKRELNARDTLRLPEACVAALSSSRREGAESIQFCN